MFRQQLKNLVFKDRVMPPQMTFSKMIGVAHGSFQWPAVRLIGDTIEYAMKELPGPISECPVIMSGIRVFPCSGNYYAFQIAYIEGVLRRGYKIDDFVRAGNINVFGNLWEQVASSPTWKLWAKILKAVWAKDNRPFCCVQDLWKWRIRMTGSARK
jgi:hypothetical protein